jgi:hypothetical protein
VALHSFDQTPLDQTHKYGVLAIGNSAKVVVWNDSTKQVQYVVQIGNSPDTATFVNPITGRQTWKTQARVASAPAGFSFATVNGETITGSGNTTASGPFAGGSGSGLTPAPPRPGSSGTDILTAPQLTDEANRFGLLATAVMPMSGSDLAKYQGLDRDTIETKFSCIQIVIELLTEARKTLANQDSLTRYSAQLDMLVQLEGPKGLDVIEKANYLYYQIAFGLPPTVYMVANSVVGLWTDSTSSQTTTLSVANRSADSVAVIPFSNNPTDSSLRPPVLVLSSNFSPDNQHAIIAIYRLAVMIDTSWDIYEPGFDIDVVDLNGQLTKGPASSVYNYVISSYEIDTMTDSMVKLKQIVTARGSSFPSKVPDTATIVYLPISKSSPPSAVKQQLNVEAKQMRQSAKKPPRLVVSGMGARNQRIAAQPMLKTNGKFFLPNGRAVAMPGQEITDR